MSRRIWQDRPFLLFLLWTFVLGIALQLGSIVNPQIKWLMLAMWAPTIAVIAQGKKALVMIVSLRKFDWNWVVIGILLGLAPHVISQGAFALFGVAEWNPSFILAANGNGVEGILGRRFMLGNGPQDFPWLALNLFLTASFAGILATFGAALGEEIGWRGFLQPHLSHRYGFALGTLGTGVLWALWYLPWKMMTIPEGDPTTFFLLIPVTLICLGFILGALRTGSHSIWPCAFMSGFYLIGPQFFFWIPEHPWGPLFDLFGALTVTLAFLTILYKGRHPALSASALQNPSLV